MGRIVRKTREGGGLSDQRKAELRALSARPDSEIDLSDIPEANGEFWQNAIRNPLYRPLKKQITLRIDADILAWLQTQAPQGYQSRLNAVLRSAMLQDLTERAGSGAKSA